MIRRFLVQAGALTVYIERVFAHVTCLGELLPYNSHAFVELLAHEVQMDQPVAAFEQRELRSWRGGSGS